MKLPSLCVVLSSASLLFGGCLLDNGIVDITVQGEGRVISNPQGITCSNAGGDCEAQLGSSYVLYAEASSGSHFDHWAGDELCTRRGQASVVVSVVPERKVSCTAVFTADQANNTP